MKTSCKMTRLPKKIKLHSQDVDLVLTNPEELIESIFEQMSRKQRREFLVSWLEKDIDEDPEGQYFVDNDKISEAILFHAADYDTLIFYKDGESENYRMLAKIKDLIQGLSDDGHTWAGLTNDEVQLNRDMLKECLNKMHTPKDYDA